MKQNYFHTTTDSAPSSWFEYPLTEEQLDLIYFKSMIDLDSLLDVHVSTFSSARRAVTQILL
jgi:hypothetical protein